MLPARDGDQEMNWDMFFRLTISFSVLLLAIGSIYQLKIISNMEKRLPKPERPEYRTTDGNKICPRPGMTDADLEVFETAFREQFKKHGV